MDHRARKVSGVCGRLALANCWTLSLRRVIDHRLARKARKLRDHLFAFFEGSARIFYENSAHIPIRWRKNYKTAIVRADDFAAGIFVACAGFMANEQIISRRIFFQSSRSSSASDHQLFYRVAVKARNWNLRNEFLRKSGRRERYGSVRVAIVQIFMRVVFGPRN